MDYSNADILAMALDGRLGSALVIATAPDDRPPRWRRLADWLHGRLEAMRGRAFGGDYQEQLSAETFAYIAIDDGIATGEVEYLMLDFEVAIEKGHPIAAYARIQVVKFSDPDRTIPAKPGPISAADYGAGPGYETMRYFLPRGPLLMQQINCKDHDL